jgi:hypothetical protein
MHASKTTVSFGLEVAELHRNIYFYLIPHFLLKNLHILHLCFISHCQCYYIWKCAHRPCAHQPSHLIPHFFPDFLNILQLCFISHCQCDYIWKCVHRPCAHQPSTLIFHGFLIFLHILRGLYCPPVIPAGFLRIPEDS